METLPGSGGTRRAATAIQTRARGLPGAERNAVVRAFSAKSRLPRYPLKGVPVWSRPIDSPPEPGPYGSVPTPSEMFNANSSH